MCVYVCVCARACVYCTIQEEYKTPLAYLILSTHVYLT